MPGLTIVNGDPYLFAVPTLHRERGFRFAFFAGDGDEPAHVHVSGNSGRAKVWLVPAVRLDHARGYSKRQLGTILDITATHQGEWLRAWRGFFG